MKKYFSVLFLLFLSIAFSQVSVGKSHIGLFKDFSKNEYDLVKKKTTIFVVDDLELELFSKMISSIWTFNKYQVVDRTNYNKDKANYITADFAVFLISGDIHTVRNTKTGFTTEYVHLNYNYFYYDDIKFKNDKLKYNVEEVASIFLSADRSLVSQILLTNTFGNLDENVYNYKIGFLKNNFQEINNKLETKGYLFAYENDIKKAEIKKLKDKILYVPDFLITKLNAWTGEEYKTEIDKLFKNYDHKYELISSEMLSEKILNATEDFFYITYIRVNSQKFVNVVNGKTGEIIYRDYDTMSYNINSKDFNQLNNKIK